MVSLPQAVLLFRRWNLRSCPKCGGEMTPTGKDEFWT